METIVANNTTIKDILLVALPFIAVPNKNYFYFSYEWFFSILFKQKYINKEDEVGHLRRYELDNFARMIKKMNTEIVDVQAYGFFMSGYIKKLPPYISETLNFLVIFEHKVLNFLKIKRSEGFFIVFQKKL